MFWDHLRLAELFEKIAIHIGSEMIEQPYLANNASSFKFSKLASQFAFILNTLDPKGNTESSRSIITVLHSRAAMTCVLSGLVCLKWHFLFWNIITSLTHRQSLNLIPDRPPGGVKFHLSLSLSAQTSIGNQVTAVVRMLCFDADCSLQYYWTKGAETIFTGRRPSSIWAQVPIGIKF